MISRFVFLRIFRKLLKTPVQNVTNKSKNKLLKVSFGSFLLYFFSLFL